MLHLSLKKAKMTIWGIKGKSTSLGFLGGWDQNYRATPLVRHFWAHKEKVIGSQYGFTRGKSCQTNTTACYDKMTGLVE